MGESEAFNEEVAAFRKACNDIRLKMPGPSKIRALRELSEKQRKKRQSETRVLQDVLLEYVSVEIDDDYSAGKGSKGTTMKMIYDKKLDALLDPANMFIGDVDPLMNSRKQVVEILSQNRPLYEFENEKAIETGEESPEQSLVWICYITDNYGNPLVAKVVSTKKKALEWLSDAPHTIGKKDDDEVRCPRFVETYVLEMEGERP